MSTTRFPALSRYAFATARAAASLPRVLVPVLASAMLASASSAGQVIRVPSGGSIQAAINVAQNGDVILVHPGTLSAPATYPSFTIFAKAISVVCEPLFPGAKFRVLSSVAGSATVSVFGLSQNQNVTLGGFDIDQPLNAAAPAILVLGPAAPTIPGLVRIFQVSIQVVGGSGSVPFDGLIEARHQAGLPPGSVCLREVNVATSAASQGVSWTTPAQRIVCGLFLRNTSASVFNSTINGLAQSGTGRGGDGVQVDTGSALWFGPQSTAAGGSAGSGQLGAGFPIHELVAAPQGAVQVCGATLATIAGGPTYGVLGQATNNPPLCPNVFDPVRLNDMRLPPPPLAAVRLGEQFTMNLASANLIPPTPPLPDPLPERLFILLVSNQQADFATSFQLSAILGGIPGVGRELAPINASATVAMGMLPATGGPLSIPVTIPGDPQNPSPLILGQQLVFQAIVLSPHLPTPLSFAMSSALTYVIKD